MLSPTLPEVGRRHQLVHQFSVGFFGILLGIGQKFTHALRLGGKPVKTIEAAGSMTAGQQTGWQGSLLSLAGYRETHPRDDPYPWEPLAVKQEERTNGRYPPPVYHPFDRAKR